jgi:cytochrome c-type biogenesis protein CcmH/NrfF
MPASPRLRRSFELALLSLAVLAFLGAADPSSTLRASEDRFHDVGHKLMCVCSCNQVLLECNHVGCPYSDRMRNELAANLGRGDSDDLTLQAFVQKYGPTVLLAPTTAGFNRVAWVVPYLALALGLTTAILVVRAWRARPQMVPAGGVAPVHGEELAHFREQAREETEV